MRPKIQKSIAFAVWGNALEHLGFSYSITEGGYISPDRSTIVIDSRIPYIGEVMPFHLDKEAGYNDVVTLLRDARLLEE